MTGTVHTRVVPEIEGMRALAVLGVCCYHYRLGVPGGQIGVDVFFVLSGFLITGVIIRELETTGRFSFLDFYARRVRRLIPAASVVLLVSLCTSLVLLDARAHARDARDAIWAAGFAENVNLMRLSIQSFNDHAIAHHYWSLSVEEQFYLIWPLLIVGAAKIFGLKMRHGVVLMIVVVIVGSFPLGLGSNQLDLDLYFSSLARAWELAAGGLLYATVSWRRHPWGRASLGWIGLLMVLFAAFVYSLYTSLPGTAALMPVLGTLAVLVSVETRWGPVRVLGLRPMQWIGARSYGIYLWHWPALLILEERVSDPGRRVRILVLLVTLALADAMYRWVENPLRHSDRLVRSPSTSIALGASFVAIVVGVSAAVFTLSA